MENYTKKIIVINGSGRVGKDTFIEFFEANVYSRKIRDGYIVGDVHKISSVDKVKQIAKEMGWGGEKDDTSRKFLSNLKDLWTEFNDGPNNYLVESIDNYMKLVKMTNTINTFKRIFDAIIFCCVREPKEIDKIKKIYGDECITLLVRRKNNDIFDNHADNNTENYTYDYIVENNSDLNEFRIKADVFIDELLTKNKF